MKLLFDENLSPRLPEALAEIYPGSSHLHACQLDSADDTAVWQYAKENGFTIVSKDSDFQERSVLFGQPPKIVWLRAANFPPKRSRTSFVQPCRSSNDSPSKKKNRAWCSGFAARARRIRPPHRSARTSYYRARYYDPQAGRFVSEDPIGYGGDGPNFYLYVLGNPANWIDPFGLLAELYCESIPSTRGGGSGNLNGIKNGGALLISRAHHCYIRVKCNGKDETIELGGPVGNEKYGHPLRNPFNPKRGGIRIPIKSPSGYKCCQFEDNLLNAFKQFSGNLPEYHGYPGPNSNTFAFQTITSAGGGVEFPNTAYGWDYLP